ncbi:hypothetical protein [Streptomyces atratus]|uniref:hypothetical protein n=1 Tax=Streptomyces atratus TaxID=1893 RepID=UPI00340EC8FA
MQASALRRRSPRSPARDHKNIVRWNTYDVGGHYAAHQVPEVLARDIRDFFAGLA